MPLSHQEIVQGLHELGILEGMTVMTHISLSAFGQIDGGADTLIAALLEAVGDTGTLCMPAMTFEQPFKIATSPSVVGSVTECFRHWPGVVRSLHPTHSVCCLGPRTEEIIAGHIDQPTALGSESPWGRIAAMPDGYILLLGCDQDRNTLLHVAEEAVDAPYLSPYYREYIDESGLLQGKWLNKFPGPHRDFIGLEHLFRAQEIVRYKRIGNAMCRLMNAGNILHSTIEALQKDPAAVLCDNPMCDDCVLQRAEILRHRLHQETFTLSVVLDDMAFTVDDIDKTLWLIQRQGIDSVEIGPVLAAEISCLSQKDLHQLSYHFREIGIQVSMIACPDTWNITERLRQIAVIALEFNASAVKLPVMDRSRLWDYELVRTEVETMAAHGLLLMAENHPRSILDYRRDCELAFSHIPGLLLAFNPAHFAHMGEKPFLYAYYKGKLKRKLGQLYLTDGCRPVDYMDAMPYTELGQGHGEVKELISILRCQSFSGTLCLHAGWGTGYEVFKKQLQSFWKLMDSI